MSEISDLVTLLRLEPHPEGGWFRETWRTGPSAVPEGYPGPRSFATGIYYLLHPGEMSRWHRVRSDELWLWHGGGSLTLRLGGTSATAAEESAMVLGPDIASGARPQLLVPGGAWQSAEPAGDEPVLVSCVVAPGFDVEDFDMP